MHDIFSSEPDPLESMLRPPSSPENEALRQDVYAQTRHLLHRRRRMRQMVYVAALLLSFGAGMLATRMILPARSASTSDPLPTLAANKETPATVEDSCLRCELVKTPALDAEYLAFDSDEHRREKYVRAGDRYMTEENDPQSALRCYGNALDSGSEEDLTISPNDNWLLMAIKDARQREKTHAKQGG